MRNNTMKKLNITKEQFNRSRYFQKKYGKLEYVSESGNIYKTNKGKVLKFLKESGKKLFKEEFDAEEVMQSITPMLKKLGVDLEKSPEYFESTLELAQDRGNINVLIYDLINDLPIKDIQRVWLVLLLAEKLGIEF